MIGFEDARSSYHEHVDALLALREFNYGYGKCRETCETMVESFPQLEIRKGIFRSSAWGHRQHWWLVHGDQIVDPTALQHPDGEVFPVDDSKYVDLTDVSEDEAIAMGVVPSGKCFDCGEYIYGGAVNFCSDSCRESYEAYLRTGEL